MAFWDTTEKDSCFLQPFNILLILIWCTCSDLMHVGQTKEEIVRWEEGKKWQAKMEKVKNSLKEKERENESLSKQLSTLKDLYARLVWTSHTNRLC